MTATTVSIWLKIPIAEGNAYIRSDQIVEVLPVESDIGLNGKSFLITERNSHLCPWTPEELMGHLQAAMAKP